MSAGLLVIILVYIVNKYTKKKLEVTHSEQFVISTLTEILKFEDPKA